MPTNQRVRFHNREHRSPVDQLGEHDEGDPRRVIGTARVDPPLLVERQLLSKKEILGCELRPRSETERYQLERVDQQPAGGQTDREARAFRMLKDATTQVSAPRRLPSVIDI